MKLEQLKSVIEIVRQALTGNRVDFRGTFYAFENVELSVRPVRPAV